MQEIHTKLLISRLSLVQNIFYHYIHGMKCLIIPIICMLLSLAGCHERKPLPSLEFADSLLTDAGDKSGALRIFLQIEEQLQSRQDPYNKGLLYERIGSIYYGQMNYVRAYHYFKQARENFQVSDSLRKETEATLIWQPHPTTRKIWNVPSGCIPPPSTLPTNRQTNVLPEQPSATLPPSM